MINGPGARESRRPGFASRRGERGSISVPIARMSVPLQSHEKQVDFYLFLITSVLRESGLVTPCSFYRRVRLDAETMLGSHHLQKTARRRCRAVGLRDSVSTVA